MRRDSETAVFWLTAGSAAASLVSIAAMEALLGAACLLWIVTRPKPVRWPPYVLPLAAFFLTSLLSLAMSPNPGIGWHPIQKLVLVAMGLAAATFVTTEERANNAYKLLLATATASGLMAIVQFGFNAAKYYRTGALADDPTILNRITGPLGHWMTFSGVQLLVWCAAIPALLVLSRKWLAPIAIVATAIVLSYTRGVWLGAAAGFGFVAPALPRRVLTATLIPIVIVGVAASPFIYHRLTMSLDKGLATNYSRSVYFTVGFQMIKDHPLFGVGPERIHDEFLNYYKGGGIDFYGHLHNNFIQIAAERGLLCLAAFVWFLAELYRSLLKRLKTVPEEARWMVLSSIAALTGFIIAGMTEFNFGDSEVFVLLLFIISVPFGLIANVQEDPHSQQR